MISIKTIRNNPALVVEKLSQRGIKIRFNDIYNLDEKCRLLKTEINELRAVRNRASDDIRLSKKSGNDSSKAVDEARYLGGKLKKIELSLKKNETNLYDKLLQLPNLPHSSVPFGNGDNENVEIRVWGEKPKYNFPLKNHSVLGQKLGLFDFERSAKVAGSGFPLYKGIGAKLERNIISYMINHHVDKYNYMELLPPVLMTKNSMMTTGQIPKFEEDMYHAEKDNLYLAPTAEVPVTNYHRNEILEYSRLPINYVAYTPCFRRESGSYGKDTRGLLRVHQFNKVELVKFTLPDESYLELEKLIRQAESIIKGLGLHYRVIELCTGDLGFAAAKTYDIEIWAPGEKKWLEVSSCSNFESFQARRGNIKFRSEMKRKVDFLHTLNGSGVATPRLMVALLETYQKENGTIQFPNEVAELIGIKEIK